MKIIVDTREVQPWTFSFWETEILRQKLEYGDYAILGQENVIRIERKASAAELAQNFCKNYQRFKREFEGMSGSVEHIYLICEFPYENLLTFPVNSGIPKNKWSSLRVTSKMLVDKVELFKQRYNMECFFCNNRDEAEAVAYEIICRNLNR